MVKSDTTTVSLRIKWPCLLIKIVFLSLHFIFDSDTILSRDSVLNNPVAFYTNLSIADSFYRE